ncbi:MAG: glycosyltransferase family A protein [Candidatus Eisenbacteria bacterium]
MSTSPLVSVIIPVHDRVAEARRAAVSVLAQSYRPIEVVVIDDGSNEDLAGALADLLAMHPADHPSVSMTLRRQHNTGPAGARNRGIEVSRGPLVAFLDSDDEWHATKLERQVAFLAQSANAGFCYCQVRVQRGDHWVVKPSEPQTYDALLRQQNRIAPSALLVRRDAIEKSGPFRAGLRVVDDWEFLLRLTAHAWGAFLAEPLVTMHRAGNNITDDVVAQQLERAQLYEQFEREGFPREPRPDLARQGFLYFSLRAADAMARAGRWREARRQYGAVLRQAPAVGIVAGEWDPTRRRRVARDLIAPYAKLVRAIWKSRGGSA